MNKAKEDLYAGDLCMPDADGDWMPVFYDKFTNGAGCIATDIIPKGATVSQSMDPKTGIRYLTNKRETLSKRELADHIQTTLQAIGEIRERLEWTEQNLESLLRNIEMKGEKAN